MSNYLHSTEPTQHHFVGVFDDISVLQFPFQMGFVVVTVLVGVLEQVDTQVYMSRRNPDLTETRAPFGTARKSV